MVEVVKDDGEVEHDYLFHLRSDPAGLPLNEEEPHEVGDHHNQREPRVDEQSEHRRENRQEEDAPDDVGHDDSDLQHQSPPVRLHLRVYARDERHHVVGWQLVKFQEFAVF